MAREGIHLRCEKCKDENYITKINKKNQTEKLQMKKYCTKCNLHTMHKQKK